MASISFPPEIEKALVASKKHIEDAEKELARAERVGLDVSVQRQVVEQAKKMRSDLLAEYGASAIRTR